MHSVVVYSIINALVNEAIISMKGWREVLLGMLEFIPLCTLVPRFILNLRALYARNLRGRQGSDIDTAFGFTSEPDHGAAVRTILIADGEENEGLEQGEEIQMEESEIRTVDSYSSA